MTFVLETPVSNAKKRPGNHQMGKPKMRLKVVFGVKSLRSSSNLSERVSSLLIRDQRNTSSKFPPLAAERTHYNTKPLGLKKQSEPLGKSENTLERTEGVFEKEV